jgi:hypothetical protein
MKNGSGALPVDRVLVYFFPPFPCLPCIPWAQTSSSGFRVLRVIRGPAVFRVFRVFRGYLFLSAANGSFEKGHVPNSRYPLG